jgi:hypothetical protein
MRGENESLCRKRKGFPEAEVRYSSENFSQKEKEAGTVTRYT